MSSSIRPMMNGTALEGSPRHVVLCYTYCVLLQSGNGRAGYLCSCSSVHVRVLFMHVRVCIHAFNMDSQGGLFLPCPVSLQHPRCNSPFDEVRRFIGGGLSLFSPTHPLDIHRFHFFSFRMPQSGRFKPIMP